MKDVFTLASIYLLAMIFGYALRRVGILKKEDKKTLSNLIFYVTLPAMLIGSYSDVAVNPWYVVALGLGLLVNAVMVCVGILASTKKSPDLKAIYTINASGFNLANIAIPFLKNFYPGGIPYLCMFDTGDSCFTLGTTYAIASMRMGKKTGNPALSILKSLISSPPFDTYIIMTILAFLQIRLPAPVYTFANFCGAGNGFLATIMVGISLEFHMNKDTLRDAVRILCMRYAVGAVAALFIYFLLPAPLEMRQTLSAAMFAAVPLVAIIYNERLGISTDIAATLNPLSTILMLPLMSLVIAFTM